MADTGTFGLTEALIPDVNASKNSRNEQNKPKNEEKSSSAVVSVKRNIKTSQQNVAKSSKPDGILLTNKAEKQDEGGLVIMANKDKTRSMPSFNKVSRLERVEKEFQKQLKLRENERKDRKKGEKLNLSLSSDKNKKLFIDIYNELISKDFDMLYKTNTRDQINVNLQELMKKKFFQDEITKLEDRIEAEKKIYNNIKYQISQKDLQLKILEKKNEDLENHTFHAEDWEEKIDKKRKELKELEEKLEVVKHRNESLSYMRKLKKETLLVTKKKVLDQDKVYEDVISQIEDMEHMKTKEKWTIDQLKREHKNIEDQYLNFKEHPEWENDPLLEDRLDDEVSVFEDQRIIEEIVKHEKDIEKKHEKEIEEIKKKKIDENDNARKKEYDNQKIKTRITADKLKERQKIYRMLKEATHVESRDGLVSHLDELEQTQVYLHSKKDELNNDIDLKKKELAELQHQLKELQLLKTPENTFTNEDGKDPYIEQAEIDLTKSLAKLQELELGNERLYKLISSICTVISRILFQLERGKKIREVSKDNVVECLSACGLKLEKMLTIIVKKKKTFRIESINTDGTFDKPPEFLGIYMNKNPQYKEKDEDSDNNEPDMDEKLIEKEQQRIKQDNERLKREDLIQKNLTSKHDHTTTKKMLV